MEQIPDLGYGIVFLHEDVQYLSGVLVLAELKEEFGRACSKGIVGLCLVILFTQQMNETNQW